LDATASILTLVAEVFSSVPIRRPRKTRRKGLLKRDPARKPAYSSRRKPDRRKIDHLMAGSTGLNKKKQRGSAPGGK
jgi:hypothetical protein